MGRGASKQRGAGQQASRGGDVEHATDAGSIARYGKQARDKLLPKPSFSTNSLTLCLQPPCAIACVNIVRT